MGRRESHDAARFYARFSPPTLSDDQVVNRPSFVDQLVVGDARHMDHVTPSSVALVVTSPPYFAGKEYEQAMGQGHVPASYLEYLDMLAEVFAECAAKLEPGGRMAVNVANLGRKPYRSLASDVVAILQDRLGLLLRGEVVWVKGKGATGSCAWGSFCSPANPVLRDLTERVLVASKGRFDRALPARHRRHHGLPWEASINRDEFLEATTDVWEIPADSASRVGHPAPFPVELPRRLIELYTFRGDLVLDPFVGSGSTAVAAVRTGRRFVGYDTEEEYVRLARERVADERTIRVTADAPDGGPTDPTGARSARGAARLLVERCGFTDVAEDRRLGPGAQVHLAAVDRVGRPWHFDVSGTFAATSGGLRSTDSLWKAIGRAAVARAVRPSVPVVLLTTRAPGPGSSGEAVLRALRPQVVADVVELLSPDGQGRLSRYAAGGCAEGHN